MKISLLVTPIIYAKIVNDKKHDFFFVVSLVFYVLVIFYQKISKVREFEYFMAVLKNVTESKQVKKNTKNVVLSLVTKIYTIFLYLKLKYGIF